MFPFLATFLGDGTEGFRRACGCSSGRRRRTRPDRTRSSALMALYEIDGSRLARHEPAALADLGLYERSGVQRMVDDEIGVLDDDLLVVAEEFSNWEDARRRIDLLAVDPAGHLVVIELKRDDAAHMDLQALRYAAFASSMDFEDVVSAYEAHLGRTAPE